MLYSNSIENVSEVHTDQALGDQAWVTANHYLNQCGPGLLRIVIWFDYGHNMSEGKMDVSPCLCCTC